MKKPYVAPELEIEIFETEDVIMSSGTGLGYFDGGEDMRPDLF